MVAMTPREDHVNFPLLLISIVAALLALMTTFLTARFYARALLRHMLRWDDWVMLAAWCFIVGCSVDIWLGIQYGVGQHYWNFEWNPFLGKSFFAYTLCWYVGTGLTKISVCLGYLRLFPGRAHQWFFHATIAFSACLALGASIIAVFRCQPISDAWARKSTHCAPYLPVQPIISASGAAINATIFLWPARFLWSLHLVPRPRRLELVILFGFGCCITFITAFRIACDVTDLFRADQRDFFRDYAWLYMLQTSELDLCVVCGCLPTRRPVFAKLCPCFFRKRPPPVEQLPGFTSVPSAD
ncbi:hypothetical protein B0J12DRAFT_739593 [Macrophomina phaseolina]|uniref:Rhodopsin domain-containing protein n=1 Tax=Macrophomina phaseolina TaxID=35725 RepID=A0ABQ8GCD9_9PEZI|nr:hypothetical protein B0J12DRAFT_739593 [Macrophomina phaseolina]